MKKNDTKEIENIQDIYEISKKSCEENLMNLKSKLYLRQ